MSHSALRPRSADLIHVHGAGGEHEVGIEDQRGLGHIGTCDPRAEVGQAELDVRVRAGADDQGDAAAEIFRRIQRRSVVIVGDHYLRPEQVAKRHPANGFGRRPAMPIFRLDLDMRRKR